MRGLRTLFLATIALAGAWAGPAAAHCDTLDGPVVNAARAALGSGNVAQALIWVRKEDERHIRNAFARARAARAGGAQPDGATDRAFYATLVKVHREGEGERFAGLKPAGAIAPHVAAADAAIAGSPPDDLERMLVEQTLAGLRQRLAEARKLSSYDPADVAAGRAYVSAYVDFVHHVERVHDAAAAGEYAHAAGHGTPVARTAPELQAQRRSPTGHAH